jgi:hypothetical protein
MACPEAPPVAEVLPADDPTAAFVDAVLVEFAEIADLRAGLERELLPENPDPVAEMRELRRLLSCVQGGGINPLGPPGSWGRWREAGVARVEMAARHRLGKIENALLNCSRRLQTLVDQGRGADIVIPGRMTIYRDPLWPGLGLVLPELDARIAEALIPAQRLGGLGSGATAKYACVGFIGHSNGPPDPMPRPCVVKEIVYMTRAVLRHKNMGMWSESWLEGARQGAYENAAP